MKGGVTMAEEQKGGNECHCKCEHKNGKACPKCVVFHRAN